jgi:hypothetical protein
MPGTALKYGWTTKVVDEGQDWQLVSNNDKVCSSPTNEQAIVSMARIYFLFDL